MTSEGVVLALGLGRARHVVSPTDGVVLSDLNSTLLDARHLSPQELTQVVHSVVTHVTQHGESALVVSSTLPDAGLDGLRLVLPSELAASVDDLGPIEQAWLAAAEGALEAAGGAPVVLRDISDIVQSPPVTGVARLTEVRDHPTTQSSLTTFDAAFAALDERVQTTLLAIAGLPLVTTQVLRMIGADGGPSGLTRLRASGLVVDDDPGVRVHVWGAAVLEQLHGRHDITAVVPQLIDHYVRVGRIDAALRVGAGDPLGTIERIQTLESDVQRSVFLGRLERNRIPSLSTALRAAITGRSDPRAAAARAWLDELDGDALMADGDWPRAARAFGNALAVRPHRAELYLKLARQAYFRADAPAAAQFAQQAVDCARDNADPAAEAQAHAILGCVAFSRGDRVAWTRAVQAARDVIPAEPSAAWVELHAAEALGAFWSGDRAGNAYHWRRGIDLALQLGDHVQVVRMLSNLSAAASEEGRSVEALELGHQAIDAAVSSNHTAFSAMAYLNVGQAQFALGRLDEALASLEEARRLWRNLNSNFASFALALRGHIHLYRGSYMQARLDFERALALCEARGDSTNAAVALVGMALYHIDENPVTALEYADQAVDSADESVRPMALSYGALAAASLGLEGAIEKAERGLLIAQQSSNTPGIVNCLLVLGLLHEPQRLDLLLEAAELAQVHDLRVLAGRAWALAGLVKGGPEGMAMVKKAQVLLRECGAHGLAVWSDQILAHIEGAVRGPAPTLRTVDRPRRVEVKLLGRFSATVNGVPVAPSAWGSRKVRALLRLLASRGGQPMSRTDLARILWPDKPGAVRSLAALVSNLRAVLDPRHRAEPDTYVGADADTLWINREFMEIDVVTFQQALARGRNHLQRGDIHLAREAFSRAVQAYRGPLWIDEEDNEGSATLRESLQVAASDLHRTLARMSVREGRYADAASSWLAALEVDPYDSTAHVGLIRTLERQGRHGESRRAYSRYADRMTELDLPVAPFPTA